MGRRGDQPLEIRGEVAPGFEPVRDAFASNLDRERGAALCIYHGGSVVVDLAAGTTADGRPYRSSTPQLVFSTSKGITSLAVHRLAQAGDIDLDQPIGEYWPEFKAHGKGKLTLRQAMAHRAGIPKLSSAPSLDHVLDSRRMIDLVANQEPLWEPNSDHGYHPLIWGWIVDGALRAVTGTSASGHVTAGFVEPLGLRLWLGTPSAVHDEASELIPAPGFKPKDLWPLIRRPRLIRMLWPVIKEMRDPDSAAMRGVDLGGALAAKKGEPYIFNDRRIWSAELPAGNVIGDAHSLARAYAATVSEVEGTRLLTDETLDDATAEVSAGVDRTTKLPARFASGFQLASELNPFLGASSFGHGGMGGSMAFADRTHGIGYAYVMNQMYTIDDRSRRIVTALAACLDGRLS